MHTSSFSISHISTTDNIFQQQITQAKIENNRSELAFFMKSNNHDYAVTLII